MFGKPETVIAELLGELRQVARAIKRIRDGFAFDDGAKIENGDGEHAASGKADNEVNVNRMVMVIDAM